VWRINPAEKREMNNSGAIPLPRRTLWSSAWHPIIPSIILFSRIINSLGSARVCFCACLLCHEIFVRRTTTVKPITVVGARPNENGGPQDKSYRKRWEAEEELEDRILACPWRQGTSRKLSTVAIRQDELLIPIIHCESHSRGSDRRKVSVVSRITP